MPRDPLILLFAYTAAIHAFHLFVLWNLSGAVRMRTKTTLNPEDAKTVVSGAAVVEGEPPEVARVMRVHRNTFDNTLPFLVLGLAFVTLRPAILEVEILFGTFTVARILYTIAYLKGLQPWRSLFYGISVLAYLGLVVEVIRHALAS